MGIDALRGLLLLYFSGMAGLRGGLWALLATFWRIPGLRVDDDGSKGIRNVAYTARRWMPHMMWLQPDQASRTGFYRLAFVKKGPQGSHCMMKTDMVMSAG